MASRTPNRVRNVQGIPVDTPHEDREEHARRRNSRRDEQSNDNANDTEDEDSEGLNLRGIDGLSTEELRNLMDTMDILNKLTPDAISTLTSRPLQTVKKVDEVDHRDEVTHIASLIDRHLEPLFDRKTAEVYRRSADLYEEPEEFWSRLFAGIRPEKQEKLPSVT